MILRRNLENYGNPRFDDVIYEAMASSYSSTLVMKKNVTFLYGIVFNINLLCK